MTKFQRKSCRRLTEKIRDLECGVSGYHKVLVVPHGNRLEGSVLLSNSRRETNAAAGCVGSNSF